MRRLRDVGEFDLIDLIAQQAPSPHGRLLKGIGDDCAVIAGDAEIATLVTTDTMVEGVHFDLSTAKPEGLGSKLLAVSLSDIAAMGGTPHEAFLSISASPDFDASVIERLAGGLQASGTQYGVQLAGGDTTSTKGPLVISLTLLGTCPESQVVYRSGARAGDSVFVTGTPGDSAAGLALSNDPVDLEKHHATHLLRRHHHPDPRMTAGRELAAKGIASSMIDLSDGLGGDLGHICRQSVVDVVIDPARLPVSDALRAYCDATRRNPVDFVLQGGEDYELAFSSCNTDFASDWTCECRLTYIGKVIQGSGHVRIGSEYASEPFDKKGFDHFAGGRRGTF